MQGLFKVGIIGTTEQLNELVGLAEKGELKCSDGDISEFILEVRDSIKPFKEKHKLVIDTGNSGSINFTYDMVVAISVKIPDLLVVLLVDASDDDKVWDITYWREGESQSECGDAVLHQMGIEGELPGIESFYDMGHTIDEVLEHAEITGDGDDDTGCTKEDLKYYIQTNARVEGEEVLEPDTYEENEGTCEIILNEFLDDSNWVIEGTKNLTVEYLKELFGDFR